MARVRLLLLVALALLAGGWSQAQPSGAQEPLRVLFVGNSLTATNDLPALVARLARAFGPREIQYRTIAPGGTSIEDHWNAGEVPAELETGKWDVVVMQQGPSALPESQANLIEWATRMSEHAREHGVRPALLTVWPESYRRYATAAVIASYANAAKAANAELYPAGVAWRAAWRRQAEPAPLRPGRLPSERARHVPGRDRRARGPDGGRADRPARRAPPPGQAVDLHCTCEAPARRGRRGPGDRTVTLDTLGWAIGPEQNLSSLFASSLPPVGTSSRDNGNEGRKHPQALGIAVLVPVIVLAWSVAGGAAVAVAPTATTGPVTSVGPTTATVTGSVNPNGLATTWYVDYGTSTSYGSKTSNANAGSGTANTAVSANLTGLTPGATYHYRVVATNSSGTTRGADGIFTTSAAPVAVTGSATSVTVTSATLNGTVDPNSRATSWYFEYGTSTSYGSKTAAKSAGAGTSTMNVSAPVSGLTRGRLYHYRLVATSDAGTSRGADQTFSTSTAPTVVTGSASSIGLTSAKLNGTVTPNGQATSWYFEYGTSTSYGTKTAVKSAGSGTSTVKVAASLTRLRATTTYHYRLVATNASGTSVGGDQSFSTALPPAVATGAAQDVGSDDRDAVRLGRPERARDDLVVRVRHVDGLRVADVAAEAPAPAIGAQERDRSALEPHTGDHVPLSARREERCGNEPGSRCRVHDGRRDAHRAGAPRRLRPWHPAGGDRPDQAGRRSP